MTELPKAYDPSQVEAKWYRVWTEQGYFHADASTPKTPYSIVIPPPNVTGSLHMGHAMYVIQDVLVRWRRMQAFNALWLPGTDHAGIATQLVVERMLKKEEGVSRHNLGREAFVERVWQWKEKYGNRINEQLRVLGFSLDWQRSRFTMEEDLSRAVREAFVRLYEDGLIYRDFRLINWCPADCRTALSDLEVENVESDGKIWKIRYPVVGQDGESQESLVVATTRPETLLGDTAVAVHPEDPRYKHLIGKEARLPLTGRTIRIIGDPILVSMEFGTGAVKVTPGHDFNDFETGKRHNLEQISVIDQQGRLNSNVPERFQGLGVVVPPTQKGGHSPARKAVLDALVEEGLLVSEEPHKLSIGVCQRCETVVEPLLSLQWFVRTEPLAKPAIAAVEQGKTRFVPETWQDDYFRWMRNIRDWCISRQLWWGHRIPAYYDPEDESKVYVARTKEEACQKAGRTDLRQDDDVLDTWFSSALWPFSTLGWPNNTKELKTFYPTSVMETGHDIIFFWVARMMMMGLYFLKKVPFKTVLLHALVVDERGEKMSKVKGNVIDPLHLVNGASMDEVLGITDKTSKKDRDDALRKFKEAFPDAAAAYPAGFPRQGADALRFFLTIMGGQGRNIRLSIPRVDGYRHFMNKIWSAARFFQLNGAGTDPDWFQEALRNGTARLSLADRYILSRLTKVTQEVDDHLSNFKLSDAAQALYRFFWTELCDWYIEMCKPYLAPKFEGLDPQAERLAHESQRAAQGTLATVLETSMRLLHPFIPFITEEIWTQLPRPSGSPQSVMITMYPMANDGLRDEAIEREVATVQTAVSAIRTIKSLYNIGGERRAQFVVKTASEEVRTALLKNRSLVELLIRADLVDAVAEFPQQRGVIANVVEGQTVFLLDAAALIDVPSEQARLGKEMAKVEKDLGVLRGRLGNADFVARAKPEVVERDRARITELETRATEIAGQLAALADVGAKA